MEAISAYFHHLNKLIYDAFVSFSKTVIAQGPLPKHIAFIMDGNRRYARKKGLYTHEGHIAGDASLRTIIRNCIDLGVKVISVYAFSIDNFNRTPEEVQKLLELARTRFEEFSDSKSMINKLGVRVLIVGNLSLLSKEDREACELVMNSTSQNKVCDLVVYLSYTSTDEFAHVVQNIVSSSDSDLTRETFSISTIEKNLYHSSKYPLELLIRTSGETRLSDFLLWQCSIHNPIISFVEVSWPELDIPQLLPVFLRYQICKANS